jgi:hypothetical protein
VNNIVLIAGLLCYVTPGVIVARGHFSSARMPREVRYGIIVSYFGLAAFIYLMVRDQHASLPLVAALAIFAVSLALFLWAVKTTRSKRLKLAFDPEPPGLVARTGPIATSGIRSMRHTSCSGSDALLRRCIRSCSFFSSPSAPST